MWIDKLGVQRVQLDPTFVHIDVQYAMQRSFIAFGVEFESMLFEQLGGQRPNETVRI